MQNLLLQKAFEKHGLSVAVASQKSGLRYQWIYQQFKGLRPVSAEYAIRYEKLLGIPRWELRPDLWECPAASGAGQNHQGEEDATG